VLGKVASIVQKNMGNLTTGLTGGGILGMAGGLAGGVLSGLMSKAKNLAAQNTAAAKILNKSPLEINDVNPIKHMTIPNFQYGVVYYPEDVQNLGSGHYLFIDCLRTITSGNVRARDFKGSSKQLNVDIPGALGRAGRNSRLQQSGISKRVTDTQFNLAKNKFFVIPQETSQGFTKSRHTEVADTIVLYTPPGIKTSYSVQHEGTELGALADVLGAASGDLLSRLGEVGTKFGAEIIAAASALTPGPGDLKAAAQKVTGKAFNNNLEMVFKGVPMREFQYTFEFAPKNKRELDSAQKIINLLKFHMHPDLTPQNDFIVPSQFQLTYMYMEKANTYIPKISKCVLKSLDLQHGDENVFSTFVGDDIGAAPIYTKMTLQFAETEIMTKGTINEGF